MLKKLLLLLMIISINTLPACALKIKGELPQWGVLRPAKINSVSHALEINAMVDRLYAPFYIANLNCHEFTRTYPLKSSEGNTYLRPRARTIRITKDASIYLKQLFSENEGNIYFKAYGFGLYGNFVGEFFIGNKSVNKIMIEKGYCDYVN